MPKPAHNKRVKIGVNHGDVNALSGYPRSGSQAPAACSCSSQLPVNTRLKRLGGLLDRALHRR